MGRELHSPPTTHPALPSHLLDRLPALESVYAPVDGYAIARDARRKLRQQGDYTKSEGLQYGEVDLPAFASFLQQLFTDPHLALPDDRNLSFADVGSGTGKPVLLAALFPHVGHSLGIEIVPELHHQATIALQQLAAPWPDVPARVDLRCASCFADPASWLAADIVYLPCTCFTDEMMAELTVLLHDLRAPQAVVITTTRTLTGCAHLQLVRTTRCQYKRGSLDFHIYQRKAPASPAPALNNADQGSPPRKAPKPQGQDPQATAAATAGNGAE